MKKWIVSLTGLALLVLTAQSANGNDGACAGTATAGQGAGQGAGQTGGQANGGAIVATADCSTPAPACTTVSHQTITVYTQVKREICETVPCEKEVDVEETVMVPVKKEHTGKECFYQEVKKPTKIKVKKCKWETVDEPVKVHKWVCKEKEIEVKEHHCVPVKKKGEHCYTVYKPVTRCEERESCETVWDCIPVVKCSTVMVSHTVPVVIQDCCDPCSPPCVTYQTVCKPVTVKTTSHEMKPRTVKKKYKVSITDLVPHVVKVPYEYCEYETKIICKKVPVKYQELVCVDDTIKVCRLKEYEEEVDGFTCEMVKCEREYKYWTCEYRCETKKSKQKVTTYVTRKREVCELVPSTMTVPVIISSPCPPPATPCPPPATPCPPAPPAPQPCAS